jgi:cysteine desulfurase family protein
VVTYGGASLSGLRDIQDAAMVAHEEISRALRPKSLTNVVYLDNASTSWPKPPQVLRAIADFLQYAGGNPGRAGHRLSIEAGRIVYDTREALAELFGVRDPMRVVFAANVTQAINTVLRGLLRQGQRVVTTGIEHNAVMRPLRGLERRGVKVTVVPCAPDGTLDPDDIGRAVRAKTRLVVLNHASNVTGTIAPVDEVARIAHQHGALVLVDAAQSAGVLPIDLPRMGADFLAFTGHKGLYGPQGIGGLVLGDGVSPDWLDPLIRGGTGSNSEYEEQPDHLPDKYESGTQNGLGIAGLGAGVRFVLARGVETIRAHETALTGQLLEGLAAIPGVTLHGPREVARRTAVVAFTVAGRCVAEVGFRLDDEHGILCRAGLHCAPVMHRTLGTFPDGTVRVAPGIFTTAEEVRAAVEAVREVVGR